MVSDIESRSSPEVQSDQYSFAGSITLVFIRTTQEIYSHMIHGQDDEAARRWEEFQNQNTAGSRSRRGACSEGGANEWRGP
jgi:hypothetical protein